MTETSPARRGRRGERRRGLRASARAALDPAEGHGRLSPLNLALCVAIVSSVAAAILETEPLISAGREGLFHAFELAFGLLFAVEYMARVWIAPERAPDRPAWRARVGWMLSPPALVDLVAFLPVLCLAAGAPTLVLRLLRLLRILRLANLGPMSLALNLVLRIFRSRRHELSVTLALGCVLLILAAALLHAVEGALQPEAFGSIPRSLWWGVVTLTTIGYGDVYPITALGKIIAGSVAIVGIGLIAAPTGILAAGFADALRSEARSDGPGA